MTKKVGRITELRYRPDQERNPNGTFKKENNSFKGVDNGGESDYNEIKKEIKNNPIISDKIGIAEKPIPVDIKSYHKHALKRMEKRNITKEDAQSFVDTSLIAFNQNTAEAYYSSSGVSVVRKSDSQLITTFDEKDFDESAKEIIKVANKYGKK